MTVSDWPLCDVGAAVKQRTAAPASGDTSSSSMNSMILVTFACAIFFMTAISCSTLSRPSTMTSSPAGPWRRKSRFFFRTAFFIVFIA